VLDRVLTPAAHPRPDQPLVGGRIYLAAPDHHLLVTSQQRIELSQAPRENRFRPSIDVLFRSAAQVYGPATIAVLLSGVLFDGITGAALVRALGGSVIVQDPTDAMFDTLPRHAMSLGQPYLVLPGAEIPATLCRLATGGVRW
jgi:two-component system chemotaxis response regulator CheB